MQLPYPTGNILKITNPEFITYKRFLDPFMAGCIVVKVTPEQVTRAKLQGNLMAEYKLKSPGNAHLKKDAYKLADRYTTGYIGEQALENLYRILFTDWNIGRTEDFNRADMFSCGHLAGVKTVKLRPGPYTNGALTFSMFPLIGTGFKYPQIMCFWNDLTNEVIITGVALPEVQALYTSRNLTIIKSLNEHKTAFYGIPFCIPAPTYDVFCSICPRM